MPIAFSACKFTYTLICLCGCFSAYGQTVKPQSFSQQLAITSDNDRYLFQGKDGYYTNGLSVIYSKAQSSKKPSIVKMVNHFELGQKIYTPASRKIYVPSQIDRPITGYLYLKFSQSRFLQHNRWWEWSVSAGTIGKAAQGKAAQDAFHKLIGINTDWWGWIWNYQLKSEPGINAHTRYAHGLMKVQSGWLQLTPVSQATIGTSFVNFSQSLLLQLGKFNPHAEGAYWGAALQNTPAARPANAELFFYYHPEATYQLYNATVQGGLFRKDKGPITSPLKALVLLHQAGACFSMNRYAFRVAVNFQTREASSQRASHAYGSICGVYRFR